MHSWPSKGEQLKSIRLSYKVDRTDALPQIHPVFVGIHAGSHSEVAAVSAYENSKTKIKKILEINKVYKK